MRAFNIFTEETLHILDELRNGYRCQTDDGFRFIEKHLVAFEGCDCVLPGQTCAACRMTAENRRTDEIPY